MRSDEKVSTSKKPPGWFSRRHETNAEHLKARARYKDKLYRPRQYWLYGMWVKE